MQKVTNGAFRSHPDLQQALEDIASAIEKKKGAVLFRQGQAAKGAFLVRRGKVLLSVQTPPAGAVMPQVAGPGSVLGLPANICGKPYSLTAVALEDCELGFVDRKKLLSLLRKDGHLCLCAVEILGRELRTLRNELSASPKHAARAAGC